MLAFKIVKAQVPEIVVMVGEPEVDAAAIQVSAAIGMDVISDISPHTRRPLDGLQHFLLE
jgi:hypothetical protein